MPKRMSKPLWLSGVLLPAHTYLLSSSSAGGVRDVDSSHYLDAAEQERYMPIDGTNIAAQLKAFFSAHQQPSRPST